MKHITKNKTELGHASNGYRVCMQKKGIVFCKYVLVTKMSWEEAEREAIAIEEYLTEKLAECNTQDEVINFYLEWRKKND